MVGDALLAVMAKSNRVLPIMAIEHADFEQPISGKARLGDLLLCSVLSNANIPSQISRHRNVSRSQGNVAWIVPTMIH
jgi:hypothetical protein